LRIRSRRGKRRGRAGADRAADSEHASVCAGRVGESGARGSGRRALHWGRRGGARIPGASRTDGATFRTGSVQRSSRRAVVPDRGQGEVESGWRTGISGTAGQSGKDSRVPDRVGRNRSGAGKPRAGAGSGGGGEGRRSRRASNHCLRGGGSGHQRRGVAPVSRERTAKLHDAIGIREFECIAHYPQRQSGLSRTTPSPCHADPLQRQRCYTAYFHRKYGCHYMGRGVATPSCGHGRQFL
jgi:hypothetical protein